MSLTLAALNAATSSLAATVVLVALSAVLCLYAGRWTCLAARSGVGACSEARVRRALRVLEDEGWRLRCSLLWDGHGDIDCVVVAPAGVAFAIEIKTRSYTAADLAFVRAQARWLQRRRRRWCLRGARPVLCTTRGPRFEHLEGGVVVVSVDRLTATLRVAAGTAQRPSFLATASSTGS